MSSSSTSSSRKCSVIIIIRDTIFSAANFAKFRGAICETLRNYAALFFKYPTFCNTVVLIDNTANYKEFIVTSNTKTYYIIFVHINIIHAHHVIHVIIRIIIINVSMTTIDFIVCKW